MTKKYNTRLIRLSRSYKVYEMADLFGVSRGTVRNWIKSGLPTIDEHKHFMVHGMVLKKWLDEKQQARKRPIKPDEFYCLTCQLPRKPEHGSVTLTKRAKTVTLKGVCPVCGSPIFRFGSIKKIPEYATIFQLIPDPPKAIKGVFLTNLEL